MERQASGITGFDEIINGGFLPRQSYLVRGGPGSGKTTFCLQWLEEGDRLGQGTLFVAMSEASERIQRNAERMKIDVSGVDFLDMSPAGDSSLDKGGYDVFTAGEMEFQPMLENILERVESSQPDRIVLDGITQLQMLSPDIYHFRKQLLVFLEKFLDQETTVLVTSESGEVDDSASDRDLQFLVDGVVQLSVGEVRTIEVQKFRGSSFQTGEHHLRFRTGGIRVYRQMIPDRHSRDVDREVLSTGVEGLDDMLEGGIERGTATLITGPTGSGKTTLGLQFLNEMAQGDDYGILYSFEEDPQSIVRRGEEMGFPIEEGLAEGTLSVEFIEPLRYTPLEFAHLVRGQVEEQGASLVMIDSMKGYEVGFQQAEPAAAIRPLVRYLGNMGVTSFLINETPEITGEFRGSDKNLTHLVDNIFYLRYLRQETRLRKAFGVLKKRASKQKSHLRHINFGEDGVRMGDQVNKRLLERA